MHNLLERPFRKMGADVQVNPPRPVSSWRGPVARGTSVNVRDGVFIVNLADGATAEVVNLDAKDRHLLLSTNDNGVKAKFLCGHDERHWFVAAVPERAAATTVRAAKIALQPEQVQEALKGVKRSKRGKRRNAAFVRQGEWFFLPAPEFDPTYEKGVVFEKNAPISRGRGNPHMVEEICRWGGVTEYEISLVLKDGKSGPREMISAAEWGKLSRDDRRRSRARMRTRDATVYARGTVRHPDHATIKLDGWHRVVMNTEQKARAMQWVAFYD